MVVEVGDRVIHVEHAYESYDIDFCVYRCRLVSGEIRHGRIHDHRWVQPDELDDYEFPPADEKSIALLLGPLSPPPAAPAPSPHRPRPPWRARARQPPRPTREGASPGIARPFPTSPPV